MSRTRKGGDDAELPYGSRRVTPHRRLIAQVVEMMPGAFTVDELLSAVRGLDATVGTATVYRSVAHLEESSWIERVGERAGSALFARCPAEDHHHHLVCTSCGKIAPAACPLEGDLTKTAERAGFLVTEHHVTLYGLCSSCRIDSGGAS